MQTAKRIRKSAKPVAAQGPRTMNTVVVDQDTVHIPVWVTDLEAFRRWVHSEEVPEKLRVCYLNGEVWVDMSNEQYLSHNDLKTDVNAVLRLLVRTERLGRYNSDGMLLTNPEANLSAGPDGVFVSHEALASKRVRPVEGKKEGYVELEGTPDMALEVVSAGSVKKDKVTLRDLYWKAGITEYWLVDARGPEIEFEILRHTAKGYAATRKQEGWVKSAVFGKSFRLTSQQLPDGDPEYVLAVR